MQTALFYASEKYGESTIVGKGSSSYACLMMIDGIVSGPDALSGLVEAIEKARPALPQHVVMQLTRLIGITADETSRTRFYLCGGGLRFNDRCVSLSEREFELCAALAWYGAMNADALSDLLFPDVDPMFGSNRVRVITHRVRQRVSSGIIQFSGGFYHLASEIEVDVKVDEQALVTLGRRDGLDEGDIDTLRDIVRRYFDPQATVPSWPWFAPIAARIEGLGKEALLMLANHSLVKRRLREAERLARLLRERDPYDEDPREILIRAYLALGARAKAMREYRSYEQVLARDLRISPPPFLRSLVVQ